VSNCVKTDFTADCDMATRSERVAFTLCDCWYCITAVTVGQASEISKNWDSKVDIQQEK
jgi:hypothetical protein